jgi:hypothetical protein
MQLRKLLAGLLLLPAVALGQQTVNPDQHPDHDALNNVTANEHIDWTVDQSPTAINTNNFDALQNVVEDTTPQLGGDLEPLGYGIKLSDSAGVDLFEIKDSAGSIRWSFNSNGETLDINPAGTTATIDATGASVLDFDVSFDFNFDAGDDFFVHIDDAGTETSEFTILSGASGIDVFSVSDSGDIEVNPLGGAGNNWSINMEDVSSASAAPDMQFNVSSNTSTGQGGDFVVNVGESTSGAGGAAYFDLGDATGASKFYIRDNADVTQHRFDSGGEAHLDETGSGSDVGASSCGSDTLSIGSCSGDNVGIDANEIMARNNGSINDLFLNNATGGEVVAGGEQHRLGHQHIARAYRSSSNITTATGTITKVDWNAESRDPGNRFNLTNDEYTCEYTGLYLVTAAFLMTSHAAGTDHRLYVYVNGSAAFNARIRPANNLTYTIFASDVVACTAGQAIDVRYYTSAADAIASSSTNTFVSILYVGPQ